ncbi:protein of unknown function [Flexibacter flexilis DSM 6793]|uniref:DUF4386 domain-containing protein n=1 Tax=Flexibacter flexilis DSM 6793 TaxID=927664 RepID=A0A1I1DWW2_9BACT|nr:DUF4386 domain-containing protein [Flexibacter flexilis]SFB77200.1 protein of unknown function [Flexibacter flexilis DSM 6793]
MKIIIVNTNKTIGYLLICASFLLFIPYIILSIIFEYPVILRQETGIILTKFYQGNTNLILVWWAFAMVGLPILEACILLGQRLEKDFYFMRWATVLGIVGLVVQMLGLLRWVFVVPLLAKMYVKGDVITQKACVVAFQVVHQYGGVVLGEYVGQLFTIAWTIMLSSALQQSRLVPMWLAYFGYVASGIYLLAQTELVATVIESFLVIGWAGLVGSTLWLLWLLLLGVWLLRIK